jgi:hypothetical protein
MKASATFFYIFAFLHGLLTPVHFSLQGYFRTVFRRPFRMLQLNIRCSMKRLILGACALLLLLTLGPVPIVSAGWWWHHHSSSGPAGVGADKKMKRDKVRHERHREQHEALYSSPKSFGWGRHASPGPMGYGSGNKESGKTTARREKHHKEQLAQSTHKHHFFGWLHRDKSAPAGGTQTTANAK